MRRMDLTSTLNKIIPSKTGGNFVVYKSSKKQHFDVVTKKTGS